MYKKIFKLLQINVYESSKENPAIAHTNDFEIENLYTLLTNVNTINKLCEKHANDDMLIEILKELINEYANEASEKVD